MPGNIKSLPGNQQGVVLAVAMIFLLLMTILGVASLSTTSVEEKMATNMQESNRAFQFAESLVARQVQQVDAFATTDSGSEEAAGSAPANIDTSSTTMTASSRSFLETTKRGRTKGTAFGGSTAYNHFDVKGKTTTTSKARVTVHQGVYILGPGSETVLIQ